MQFIYITDWNLPWKLLYQQCHIHFASTSMHATVPKQFHGIKEIIEWAQFDVILEMDDNNSLLFRKTHHELIKMWNAVDGQEICLKLYCNCGPGNNPAQSKVCSHIGAKGDFPCQKCNIGGSQKEKETNEGFHKFFFVCLFILQPYLCL